MPSFTSTYNVPMSIAKGIGIFLVVVGHSGCHHTLHSLIYLFHMPLFFIISGYFSHPSTDGHLLRTHLLKRFKRLYLPFAGWSVVFLLLHNTFCRWGLLNETYGDVLPLNTTEIIHRLVAIFLKMDNYEQFLGTFWFLRALLAATIISECCIYLFHKLKIKNHYEWTWTTLMVLTAVSYLLYSTLHINGLKHISTFLLGATFYLFGYWYHTHESLLTTKRSLCFIGLCYLATMPFLINKGLSIPNATLSTFVPFFIVSTAATLLTIQFSGTIAHTHIGHFFSYLGKHTMSIFTFHLLSFRLVSWLKIQCYHLPSDMIGSFPVIEEHNGLFCLLYIIVGIGLPLLLSVIYERCKLFTSFTKKQA